MHVKTAFRIIITFNLGNNVDYHFGTLDLYWYFMIHTKVDTYRKNKLTSSSFIGTRVYYKSEMMGIVRPQGVD